ncbi:MULTISPECIES: branched-chain amino acid ABC transporter permease [unclassified Methylobacterium]|uniref:branched-chain amino acid ABC transporter permease n=1 Tax=unclassified Methylobacterium TaxID=2615210 RepID=UPI001FBA5D3E|nr:MULTISPECIES: branched-chain amino acid ABC transporter permease [unclassified Methylobacterium]MCJ2095844.1 branched-chain amino acid ABC transporter permease [Methylobacterium sp. J-072]MCJ2144230.1 branched-chain amino acid ABC transporter permease [Methylobacterium sp. E-066]
MSNTFKIFLVLVGLALVVPFVPGLIYPVFVMKVMCYGLFACAFNLLLGFTGLVSFAHAAFLGSAGYVTGALMIRFGNHPLGMPAAFVAGVAAAAFVGFAIGGLAIRRRGIYFAMITLALSQIVYFLAVQFRWTGGEDGLQGIPRGSLFGLDLTSDTVMYYVTLALFAAGFLFVDRVVHSPFGQILQAVRDNEARATSLGYDTDRFKLLAFVISAAVAGYAGAMKALVFQLVSLNDVSLHTSTEVVLMTLLGGVGTIFGPLLGAGLVVGLQNYLATIGDLVTVVIGLIFIVCVSFFRRGVVGEFLHLRRRRAERAKRRPVLNATRDPAPAAEAA